MEDSKNEQVQNATESPVKAEDIVVIGTKDPDTLKELEGYCDSHGKKLVILDDKVIDDFMKGQQGTPENPAMRLDNFLNDEKNRASAEEKALTLWNILTQNADLSFAQQRIFTKAEVCNKVTISHKELGSALQLFKLFGLVEFTKDEYEFKFIFGKETQAASILADLSEAVNMTVVHQERYVSALKNCGKCEIEIKTELDKINADLRRMLKI